MKHLLHILVVSLVAFAATGCYNDFESPAQQKVWTDADFEGRLISIAELKNLFYSAYGTGAGSLAKSYLVTEDYVISGKVISSDLAGNVYKSLYIYDEQSESSIELKLCASNNVYYHPGQTIYVETKGLAIGCYRFMLSLGSAPSDADVANGYANGNIEERVTIEEHIKPGAMTQLVAADTLVVTPSNYKTVLADDTKVLGRLIRFEQVSYKSGTYDGDTYPNYLEQIYVNNSTTATYTTKYYKNEVNPVTGQKLPDTYAYCYGNERFYGSAWFTYGETTTGTSGNYIARVSGYANFALKPLPAENTKGDITAIYVKYSSSSGGYIKYQLLINSFDDINF